MTSRNSTSAPTVQNDPGPSEPSATTAATVEWFAPEVLARTGYSIMSSEWNMLGLGEDNTSRSGNNNNNNNTTGKADPATTLPTDPHHMVETGDIVQLQHRITAIFAARCAAIVAPHDEYSDLSTKTICRTILTNSKVTDEMNSCPNDHSHNSNSRLQCSSYPPVLTQNNYKVLLQLSEFIRRMLVGYKDVPYHNRKHAYHVVLSTTKLMDMMIGSGARTYGIKHDPIALFAMVFAALIHDVEHQGIPNRQLALEDDRLAVLYNDQSMAENWSLYVAFSEFLQDEFVDLRNALFNKDLDNNNGDENGSIAQLSEQVEYRRFRKLVINLVLSTDLASPERTQIGKSKWKEAFGDPYETLERKLREVAAATMAENLQNHPNHNNNSSSNNIQYNRGRGQRRASLVNTSRMLTITPGRRGSAISAMSSSPNSRPASQHDDDEHNIHPQNNMNHNYYNSSNNNHSDDIDEDDSLSATPDASEGSDDEDDNNHNVTVAPKFLADVATAVIVGDINHQSSSSNTAFRDKFERRMSASSVQSSKYRQRLGILRTVDLSGETLETYSRRGSMATAKSNQSNTDNASIESTTNYQSMLIADEPDELKATVVMETIITAADVAHNLQSWNHMVKWSGRLYMELRRAHVAKRGFDPQDKWFENQIGFLESYLLPVARRLEDTGVFGEHMGQMFATIVEANRDRWLANGLEETQKIIAVGKKRYPPKN